eukprot:m.147821 g.147821  ORF g.147821 m.147821 type:complete len:424 (-) comp17297_c0_seq1:70-1341(-)
MDFQRIAAQMGVTDPAMLKQAEQMWEMLDNMAAKDPKQYQAFIDKQVEERKRAVEEANPPTVVFTFVAPNTKRRGATFFLSLCGHVRLKEPANEAAPIPVVVCKPVDVAAEGGSGALVVEVVFHPKVVERAREDHAFLEFLTELAATAIGQRQFDNLAFDMTALKPHARLVADPTRPPPQDVPPIPSPQDLLAKERQAFERQTAQAAAAAQSLDDPAALLEKLRGGSSSSGPGTGGFVDGAGRTNGAMGGQQPEEHEDVDVAEGVSRLLGGGLLHDTTAQSSRGGSSSGGAASASSASVPGPDGRGSGGVDEVLLAGVSGSSTGGRAGKGLIEEIVRTPEHRVAVLPGGSEPAATVMVTVELPGVASAQDVDVDVTPESLELTVPGLYHLSLTLPHTVDDDAVSAKFVKRRQRLTLTMQVANE